MVNYIGGGCRCKDLINQGKSITCHHTHEMKSPLRKPKKKGKKKQKRTRRQQLI